MRKWVLSNARRWELLILMAIAALGPNFLVHMFI